MSESQNLKESNSIGRKRDGEKRDEVEQLVGIEENPQRLQRDVAK